MDITMKSQLTGQVNTMDVPLKEEDFNKWKNLSCLHIQDEFPHLSDSEREFLLTGSTPEEWDHAFEESDYEYPYWDDEGNPDWWDDEPVF